MKKKKMTGTLLLGTGRTPPSPVQRERNLCSYCYRAKLGCDCCIANERIVINGYELIVVICNYQNYPITAESRTPQETFTTRVDPVSAPLF